MSSVYEQDPVLRNWINPLYLKTDTIRRIRESSLVKPFMRYCVLDDFFNEDVLDAYLEEHKRLPFHLDDPSKPYDSSVVYAEPGVHCGTEFYFNPLWQQLSHEYVGGQSMNPDRQTVVKLRKHEPFTKGFWVHGDRNPANPATAVILMYFNKDWNAADGSLFQLWQPAQYLAPDAEVEYTLAEYKGKRFDFLTEKVTFSIELGDQKMNRAYVMLLDQVVPAYNRVVFCDFIHNPTYHAVTPGNAKVRWATVQWIY